VHPSVPHLVVPVDDVNLVDLLVRGPALRHDPALGPGGANVNWVAKGADGAVRMRTYERGVEAETFACGTGAVACVLVLAQEGEASSPARVWTRSGLPLDITWEKAPGKASGIALSGEGRVVYRGVVGELAIRSRTDG
jgi:diaminopimelate epimerase